MQSLPRAIPCAEIPPPQGHYSPAMAFGELVFVSGQLGVRADGSHTANLGFEAQVRQTLANLLAVLTAAGAGPEHVLKVTAYVVGVENWPRLNQIYGEVMGTAKPARTVVPVPALHHGYLVEIDAIAARPGKAAP